MTNDPVEFAFIVLIGFVLAPATVLATLVYEWRKNNEPD